MKETKRNLVFQTLFLFSIPSFMIFMGCFFYFSYKPVNDMDMVSLNVSLDNASYEKHGRGSHQLEFSFSEYQAAFYIWSVR